VATFLFIHGAGDGGWSWHLVQHELAERGHHSFAPDLPAGDDSATLEDYAGAAADSVSESIERPLVVVGQSFGGFTAPLVAERLSADALVFVTGMVPKPGERPDDWWSAVGYSAAVSEQAARDGGLTGNDDPYVSFLHDVPRELAEEAMSREREHPSAAAGAAPWPLDALPAIPTRFVLCTEDRFFPPNLMRSVVADRLPGVTPIEIEASHCAALAKPNELADILDSIAREIDTFA
jgi:pimeloyl-ACP methyl ester carboxylesterase